MTVKWWMLDDWNAMDRAMATILWAPLPDPLIHSLRWVQAHPFLSKAEAEIWRDDFDPVAKWVKRPVALTGKPDAT